MKRGSIALARSLCYEIAGPTDEEDDISGRGYGSVDIAEILSAEIVRLRAEFAETIEAADDACELLEMAGMHEESAYKQLKRLVVEATKLTAQRTPASAQQP